MDDEFYNIAILSISMLAISIIFYPNWMKKAGGKRPPGPRGLPIVGYLPFFGENPLLDFKLLEEKYGPIYNLRMGQTVYTIISSPSLAKEVLRDHDAVFAHRHDLTPVAASLATYGGTNMTWSEPDSQWRYMRKLFVQQMMCTKFLKESIHVRREVVRKTLGKLYAQMAGKPVEMMEISMETEFGVLMNLVWGETVAGELGEAVVAEVNDFTAKILELILKQNVSDFIPFLARFDLQGVKREAEVQVERINKVFDIVLGEHHKRKKSGGDGMKTERRKDLIQILFELIESGDVEMSEKQLRAMMMDVIAGAADSAATVESVMWELMKNPEAMSRAQEELNDVIGIDCIVEEFHIPKLKYLERVIKETLRLHPPLPILLPHSPSQDSTIMGFHIPKGSTVFVNVWSIQRNPAYWEKPLEFMPDRFLDYANKHNFYYLPFGSGRRICSGQALAENMVLYLVASLVHSFDWTLPPDGRYDDDDDTSEKFWLGLRKSTPLMLIPTPRLTDSTLYM